MSRVVGRIIGRELFQGGRKRKRADRSPPESAMSGPRYYPDAPREIMSPALRVNAIEVGVGMDRLSQSIKITSLCSPNQ
jgi:hypothetical protein